MSEHDIDRPPDIDPNAAPDPQPASAGDQAQPEGVTVPELAPGVPFFWLDNPYGGQGIGVLASYDPEATHERENIRRAPDTDTAEGRLPRKSGGSAYYMDLTTGKGWSVPLNPEVKD